MKNEYHKTGEIRSRNLEKDRHHHGQMKKDKQRSTKHYTENVKIEQHEPH